MRRVFSLAVAVASAAWLCGCTQTFVPVRTEADSEPLNETLAELEAMPAPEGVDSALWKELKDALAASLADGWRQPATRRSSTPPTGNSSKVSDLVITSDSGRPRLVWHYRNLGDYDQNGTVAIADLTPIAQNWGATWITGAENTLPAVIDGSGNGKVDIADVTAIAVGFSVNCTAYRVQNAATATADEWSNLTEVPQEEGAGDGRLEYAVTVDPGDGEYYRVVPVDADGAAGEPSNVRRFLSEPPEVVEVSPLGGVTGTQVEFTVTVTGSEPIGVQWDFGDGASPRLPFGRQVSVTLGAVGEYPASVTASNALGSDTLDFTLVVEPVPPDPPDIQSVTPTGGVTGTQVQFSAEVTGTEPFSYHWDFGGGATPNLIDGEQPTVTLGPPGEYDASLSVTNAADEDVYGFVLEVLPASTGFKTVAVEVAAAHPSLVVADGNPAIAFTKSGDGGEAVCYVRATDELGSAWGDYQEYAESGTFYDNTMLRLVGGKPAGVSSVSAMIEGGSICFASAQDSAGDIWNPVVTVYDGFNIKPTAAGLMDVMGHPALAFSNDDPGGNCKLLYVRANDSSGADWPATFIEVAPVGIASYAQTSMVFADGNPAVLHTWWGGAIYVRSRDMYGDEWDTPIDLAGMSARSSMTLIGHNPAVAIETGGELPHALIYRRALDPSGEEWGDVVTVVSSEGEGVVGSGGRICLAEINGRPAIAYSHTSGAIWYFVKYVVAKDNQGDEWNEPVTVDPATDVSDGIALAEVAGAPAMAYGNRVGDELVYIRAMDSFGLEWPE